MKIVDPFDPKNTYPSVQAAVKHWTLMIGAELLAIVVDRMGDELYKRPDFATPATTVMITGTGVKQTVVHGLKDPDGKPVKPRAWSIVKFKGCTELDIQSADDVNLSVQVTKLGEATVALFA